MVNDRVGCFGFCSDVEVRIWGYPDQVLDEIAARNKFGRCNRRQHFGHGVDKRVAPDDLFRRWKVAARLSEEV